MAAPHGLTRFVILAAPRSGSNWLCTLLDSHPDILCHHELFNPDGVHIAWSLRHGDFSLGDIRSRQADPLGLLQRAWDQHLGYPVVGFKLNIDSPPEVLSAVLNDPAVLKIVLQRHGRIRSFLSEQIAEQSGVWESYPDSDPQATDLVPVSVDVTQLLAHAERNRLYYAELRAQLERGSAPVHEVAYESLGEADTHRGLLRFLGADDDIKLAGITRRMNPQPLPALIANYPELRKALRNTPLADELPVEGRDKTRAG